MTDPLDPLSYLFSLEQFGIKCGLDNIRVLVGALGHPERAFRTVHVAGTNGKGSITAMVDAALTAAGHRSARYTSPHLVDLAERVVINGRPVAQGELVRVVADIRSVIERLVADGAFAGHPTFFEVTTAAAFELFRRAQVGVAVIEVGLGGRLDATNVVRPAATAISSIAMDHEQYLGNTPAQIAWEKAGIVKAGVPLVLGRVEPDARQVISRVAAEVSAPVVDAWTGTTAERLDERPGLKLSAVRLVTPRRDYGEVTVGLRGTHQIDNAVVAVRLLETLAEYGVAVPREAIVAGVARPNWPGRLDLRRLPDGRTVLLDAAHNPAGATVLASYLQETGTGRLPIVLAVMRDKDAGAIAAALTRVASVFVATRASIARSTAPADLARTIERAAPGVRVDVAETPRDAMAVAWRHAPMIVVAGSIFLLGDVMKELEGP